MEVWEYGFFFNPFISYSGSACQDYLKTIAIDLITIHLKSNFDCGFGLKNKFWIILKWFSVNFVILNLYFPKILIHKKNIVFPTFIVMMLFLCFTTHCGLNVLGPKSYKYLWTWPPNGGIVLGGCGICLVMEFNWRICISEILAFRVTGWMPFLANWYMTLYVLPTTPPCSLPPYWTCSLQSWALVNPPLKLLFWCLFYHGH